MSQGARPATLLIVGSSGFLGHHLVRAAQREWCGPIVAAARTPWVPEGDGVAAHPFDAEVAGSVEELIAKVEPKVVILAAALARGGDCERDPVRAERLNHSLVERAAAACAECSARLVLTSTDLVFGAAPPPPGGFVESSEPGPTGVYGHTKLRGERAALASPAEALVARLPLLFGDSGGRGLGASDALLAELERGDDPLLFEDEWRTPLDVAIAATALVRLAGTTARGIVHLPGPERVSRAELGRRVLERAGWTGRQPRAGRRADLDLAEARPADVALAGERARLLLGVGWNSPHGRTA